MSNRRVKSLSYDDDDYDDYEDDYLGDGAESTNPEDREKLRLGAIKVKEVLGPAYKISQTDIEEALWNYWYDVGESVAYLKKKHKPKPITHPKAATSQAVSFPDLMRSQKSVKNFFYDCPWLQIAESRRAKILIEPTCVKRGLLGGSSKPTKMSKLAMLAAKRRQEETEEPSRDTKDTSTPSEDYSSSLSKLTLTSAPQNRRKHMVGDAPAGNDKNESDDETGPHAEKDLSESGKMAKDSCSPGQVPSVNRGDPSSFAQTLVANRLSSRTNLETVPLPQLRTHIFDFSQPSPDDVIMKAQNKKTPSTSKETVKGLSSKKLDVTKTLTSLSLQGPADVKSKNIDVAKEYEKTRTKKGANFVVIGHVDAGKSTLMGRLLFELKAIDSRAMEKYRKEAEMIGKGSFAFAWVLDQGSEERERGVTIDIATNRFETEKSIFTILDAPGHQDFIPNMIAGASQADFAVLVIDGSGTNFESGLKGQTKEHALLVRSMGVQRIIVAVNKMDAIEWNEDRFEKIRKQLSTFLLAAGYHAKNLAFVPCSGLQGDNILSKPSTSNASWYNGATLVEELELSESTSYSTSKPLRMTIGDVFRGSIQNPISISGRIEAGTIQVGEQIQIMPSGENTLIKSIEVDEEPQGWAVAGQNVVLNLIDIDPMYLKPGDVICDPASPIANTDAFQAKILTFTSLTPQLVDIHRGRLHVPGRINHLIATLDKTSGTEIKKKPRVTQPNAVIRVNVLLDAPVPLEAGQRVIFRSGGETIAAGLVE